MKPLSAASNPSDQANRRAVWSALALIVFVVVGAYGNSLSGVFVFDDPPSITENQTLRQLSDWRAVMSPPAAAGVGGRPVANLTFALNYAFGGADVTGYHVGNILVHVCAALALFGVVRRTLLLPVLRECFGADATWLALAIASLWAVHPVQTTCVDYVSQRTESLMGLFYLLTLYGFVRSVTVPTGRLWQIFAVATCALGMASKEVMVTAPAIMLLYDRTFIAGSFKAAWRLRWKFYLGLALTWLLLGWLMIGLETRGVGFGFKLTWWNYAIAGCYAVVTYLRLGFWPHPLVFDYGPTVASDVIAAPYAILVLALAGTTVWALWRRPFVGFLGAWFLLILAPTSSVIPIVRQMVAENRVYLPLAALVTLLVGSLYAKGGRRVLLAVAAPILVGLIFLTFQRNLDYRSAVALWSDTVRKRPENWRAHNSLALALTAENRVAESIAHYEASLRIDPTLAETHYNLGNQLDQAGRIAEAISHYETALRIESSRTDALVNLGNLLARTGQPEPAIAKFTAALRLDPKLSEAHIGLGNALLALGRLDDAVKSYHAALALNPHSPDAHGNLGYALTQLGQTEEAIARLQTSIRLRPNAAAAHYNLGNALVAAGRLPDAAQQFQTALQLEPRYAEAANNLAAILLQSGRIEEARRYFESAVRAKPSYIDASQNLAVVLLQLGLRREARQCLEALLTVQPDHADTHCNLGLILAADGLVAEARAHFETALRLKPDHANARAGLLRIQTVGPAPATP